MPQHEPSPEFAALSKPRRSQTAPSASAEPAMNAKSDEPSSSEPAKLLSLAEAQDLALTAIWPGLTAIRASILERDTNTDSAILRLRDSPDRWVLEDSPQAGDPSVLNWIPAERIAQAAAQMVTKDLLMARGVLTLEKQGGWNPQAGKASGISQTVGRSTWVQVELGKLAEGVTSLWDPGRTWPELQVENLWIAGCSDLGGDQIFVVQGTQQAMLKASKGLVSGRFRGLPVNLVLNSSIQQALTPEQAAILVPGALDRCLVFLDS